MALIHADFVEETSVTTGTGTLTLAGSATGYRTFLSAIGEANTCIYAIAASDDSFEVGEGTVTGGTLERTRLLSSSTDSLIDLPAGEHRVYCTFSGEGGDKAYTARQPADTLREVVYLTADRELVASDTGKEFVCNSASAIAITFEADLPIGFEVVITRLGAGAVTITPNPADVINGGTSTLLITEQYQDIRIRRYS